MKLAKPKKIEKKIEKSVPDTSAIINGSLVKMIKQGKLDKSEIIIPEIVMGELQAQASKLRDSGFIGLKEINKIKELSEAHKIKITFSGERPSYDDIKLSRTGRLDALIIDYAKQYNATLITSDLPQALVAEASGVHVAYFESYTKIKKLKVESLLTSDTMSLHLKEGVIPHAKRGKPGKIDFVSISKKKLTNKELEEIASEVLDAARYEEGSFIEFGDYKATVVQLRNMRIAITRPPFSDAMEITIVRPIIKLKLDDYKLSDKLKERLKEKVEGVLIAGPPGSGKSCFAASLAEFYLNQGKIVKTMESPRDLQVSDEITQYGPLDGSFIKTADILLLVRPDYTVYDEIRKPVDFGVFADMRLAGIGMIGVVHATNPIDAVQRFIGKSDLGLIPHIIDTIIYIKDGAVGTVYKLNLLVKVPTGMTESDLARPVVDVTNFETGKLEFEIYSYGEQTVVVPIKEQRSKPMQNLAVAKIREEIGKYDQNAKIEFVSDERISIKMNNDVIANFIGKEGSNIKKVEQKLGVHIDVEPMVETLGRNIDFNIKDSGGYIILDFDKHYSGENANIYIEDEYLFTATIGRSGQIKLTKSSDIGKSLFSSIATKKSIRVFI